MMLSFSVVVAICIYFYILKSGDIRWVYHEGAGLWYECQFIMIGEVIANVVLNILLCKIWGTLGIVLATAISVFLTNMILCPQILFNHYFRNGKMNEYLIYHIQYSCTMLITAIASWVICETLLPIRASLAGNILSLGGRLIICSLTSVLVFWLLWHKSNRYQNAKEWMKRLVRV
jgi:peptidoglycan biosynthesis protein MviN/MurJ (putative lipid II flippase)